MSRTYLDPGQPLLDARFPLSLDRPFTAADARAAGIAPNQLTKLCRQGYLRRLIGRVYVAAQVVDSLALRASALRRVVPADAVVTDRTAGWLHGAQMILAPGDHLEVPVVSMFVNRRGARLRNELSNSGQRFLREDEILEIHGLLVTTPLRTACDLGRLRWRDGAFAALVSMLRLGVFTREELWDFTARFRGMRQVRQLRGFIPLIDPRAESPGEAAVLLRWWDTMNSAPELQIEIVRPGQWSYWLDLGLQELRFAIEYDGKEWHRRTKKQRRRDRARRGWIRDERGWLIRPVTKGNVFGARRDIERIICAGVEQARRELRR